MKTLKQIVTAAMLGIGLATATPAYAGETEKPKVEAKAEAPKSPVSASGSLDTYIMSDRAQLDGKLTLAVDKFGAFGRVIETIDYKTGKGTAFVVGDLSYKLPAGLSMLGEVQYLQRVGTHGRLGVGAYHSVETKGKKLALSSYEQVTAGLTSKPDFEVLTSTSLEARLKPVSLIAKAEGIVNFSGEGLNYYIVRPFAGVRYKALTVGGYMQVSGGPKGKPDVAGGIGIGLRK